MTTNIRTIQTGPTTQPSTHGVTMTSKSTATAAKPSFWTGVTFAGAVSLLSNIPIFFIANAVMAEPIQAEAADGTIENLPFITIPIASLVAVILGIAFLTLAQRYNRLTPALVLVGLVGVLSAYGPSGVDVITNGERVLASMHFTTTAAVIGTQLWNTRRTHPNQ